MSRLPSFEAQVQLQLAARSGRGPTLTLCKTPAVLRLIGFPPFPLVMTAGVVWKIGSGKCGQRLALTERQIVKLPEAIDEPVFILHSTAVLGAVVVVTALKDDAGNPIVAAIERGVLAENRPTNSVATAYGKERREWFVEEIEAGRLIYADREQKKGLGTPEVSSLTLNRQTEPGSQNPRDPILLGPDDLRKFRAETANQAFSGIAKLVAAG